MKILERLKTLGFDGVVESSDLRLWSDRKSVLYFLAIGLCGSENLVTESMKTYASEFQSEDETTTAVKCFGRLFCALGLEHASQEDIKGSSIDDDRFLESAVEILELAGHSQDNLPKNDIESSGLEGFMSNTALFETACSKMKDLLKIDTELFPIDLHRSAAPFTTDVERHLQDCFGKVQTLLDRLKERCKQTNISQDDVGLILDRLHPNSIDRAKHEATLQKLKTQFGSFNQDVENFLQSFPTYMKMESGRLQGIGRQARDILDRYTRLIQLLELLRSVRSTKMDIASVTHPEALSGMNASLQEVESFLSQLNTSTRYL